MLVMRYCLGSDVFIGTQLMHPELPNDDRAVWKSSNRIVLVKLFMIFFENFKGTISCFVTCQIMNFSVNHLVTNIDNFFRR